MTKMFVDRFLFLIEYCSGKSFDPNIFQIMHDEYANAWKKLDQAEQGEITERLNKVYYVWSECYARYEEAHD